MDQRYYDEASVSYDESRGGGERARAAAAAIASLVPSGGRCLDIAGGTGIVSAELAAQGRALLVLDLSFGMLAVAARRLPGSGRPGTRDRLPVADRSVDLVTCIWMLNLVPSATVDAVLAESSRVIRVGGHLVITVDKELAHSRSARADNDRRRAGDRGAGRASVCGGSARPRSAAAVLGGRVPTVTRYFGWRLSLSRGGTGGTMSDEHKVLQRVLDESTTYLEGLDERSVAARADVDGVVSALGGPLPEEGTDALAVVEELIAGAEPGLVAMPSGRFFGWVIGGALPGALAADWLTSTWDQNAGLLASSPAAAGVERVASAWLLDLLGLPPDSGVGYVTGAMMANFTCLAAARYEVLRRVGWDANRDGLQGAPRVNVVVGAERHESVDLAPSAIWGSVRSGASRSLPTSRAGFGWTRWPRS